MRYKGIGKEMNTFPGKRKEGKKEKAFDIYIYIYIYIYI